MTLRIDRETLPCTPEELAAAVDAHIAALAEYQAHLKGVADDAANDLLAPDERRVAFPPPSAAPLIERAIRYDGQDGSGGPLKFVADYEIVGPSLELRKQRLMQKVAEAEAAEIAKVLPAGKVRYYQLLEQAVHRDDSERWNEHLKANPETESGFSYAEFVAGTRSDEDSRFLDEQASRWQKQEAIQMWAAKAMHDIEDLTEETVEGWKLGAIESK